MGFQGGATGKESPCQYRRYKKHKFNLWVGKIPWGGHGNPLLCSCLENLMDPELGRLQSVGSNRVRHDWGNLASVLYIFRILGPQIDDLQIFFSFYPLIHQIGRFYTVLRFSWASLVAQLVKNLLAMQKTWVQSLGWEDPLEKGKATHSSILVWRIPWTIVLGVTKSRTRLSDFHFTSLHFRFSYEYSLLWKIFKVEKGLLICSEGQVRNLDQV